MRRSCDLRLDLPGRSLRPLQFLGDLIDHLPSDQVILNFGVAVREAPPLLLLSLRRHRDRPGLGNQHGELVCHDGAHDRWVLAHGILSSLPYLTLKARVPSFEMARFVVITMPKPTAGYARDRPRAHQGHGTTTGVEAHFRGIITMSIRPAKTAERVATGLQSGSSRPLPVSDASLLGN
jgi:hypothetical protein